MPIDSDPVPELKRQLAAEICQLVSPFHHYIAADLLGIGQPRMSDLQCGKLERFSLQRLVRMLAEIDYRSRSGS